jgi:hypothetical protein
LRPSHCRCDARPPSGGFNKARKVVSSCRTSKKTYNLPTRQLLPLKLRANR